MDAAGPGTPPAVDVLGLVRSTLYAVVQGLLGAAATSPLLVVLFALVGAGIVFRVVRAALYLGWRRDPVRLFTRTDKAVRLARAGHRCEKHVLLSGRCRAVEKLEADHVRPWSRGGQTALPNGQVLCQSHNKRKHASVPFGWQVRRLERRRAGYFPPGVSPVVGRNATRTTRSPAARA